MVLFVGWEGVGLCSYLLIGFWFLKKTATDAGNKAFWVNRVGDFGLLLGMFLLFRQFGTLDFAAVFRGAAVLPAESAGHGVLTAIALLLLVGATGKSAQIPLYVWLPDAMEGPTPVSALIHAATMVAAGVYMVARSHVLFLHAPVAMMAVAVVGCATALFAATIALVQTDIKKVLAYSTISQLGYMFLACGVGAFGAGMFHLMTHAFFKALLFLGAGSVIHAMGGEQDMRRMGGLRKAIPWTYGTHAGGHAGHRRRARVLRFLQQGRDSARRAHRPLCQPGALLAGRATAGLTAFYMFRLLFLTFHGAPRYDEHKTHVHESPSSHAGARWWCWRFFPWPAAGGRRRISWAAQIISTISVRLLSGAAKSRVAASRYTGIGSLLAGVFGPPVIAGLLGFLLAWWLYIRRPELPERLAESLARTLPPAGGQVFRRRTLRRARSCARWCGSPTNVLWHAVDEEHRRRGERRGPRRGEVRRPPAAPEFRQYAHVRDMGGSGRGAADHCAGLDGALDAAAPTCSRC